MYQWRLESCLAQIGRPSSIYRCASAFRSSQLAKPAVPPHGLHPGFRIVTSYRPYIYRAEHSHDEPIRAGHEMPAPRNGTLPLSDKGRRGDGRLPSFKRTQSQKRFSILRWVANVAIA